MPPASILVDLTHRRYRRHPT